MKKIIFVVLVVAAIVPLNAAAQDAASVIDASAKAMGSATLQSIRYTGSGTNNSVGQAFTAGGPWQPFKVAKYVALVNYTIPFMRQEIVRIENENPPRGGGAGGYNPATGQGGIRPVPGDIIQNQNTDGRTESGSLNIWLTPHGFLKGAIANRHTGQEETRVVYRIRQVHRYWHVENVDRLKLDIQRVAHVHGGVDSWEAVLKAA